jgi:hypothetical protein
MHAAGVLWCTRATASKIACQTVAGNFWDCPTSYQRSITSEDHRRAPLAAGKEAQVPFREIVAALVLVAAIAADHPIEVACGLAPFAGLPPPALEGFFIASAWSFRPRQRSGSVAPAMGFPAFARGLRSSKNALIPTMVL